MPSVYGLKPQFQNLLRPIVRGLARAGVTANQVTVAALLLSLATGAVILWKHGGKSLLLLPAVLFVRMALNAIDGMLAREHNMKSALGAILNELGDVVADAGMYLPLAVVLEFNAWMIVGIVLLATLSEMTGVVGVQIGASRRYDGPMGKSDRAFLIGLLALLVGLNVPMQKVMTPVLILILFLLVLTVFNRARKALQELKASSATR
jgi:CDP-diacylglycerol--glycerol-3-phosphate 3-phosphatidyltransferase